MRVYEGHLTEKKLGEFLEKVYPKGTWIKDKFCKESGTLYRPDFRNDHYMLAVEYDGPGHYTSAKRAIDDVNKHEAFTKIGYTVITIPYFLQIDDTIFHGVFENNGAKRNEYKMSDFPQGFIEDKCVLPADYCSCGLLRFSSEIHKKFWPAKDAILKSLELKKDYLGESMVMPIGAGDFSIYSK